MKPKALVVLAFVTLVVVIAAAFALQGRRASHAADLEAGRLYPLLEDKINDINEIRIHAQGDEVVVRRQGDQWITPSMSGYNASFEKIKQTILGVSNMTIVDPKTSDPALYAKLGVQNIDAESATSTLVTLKDDSIEPLAELIIGASKAGGRPMLYVRKAGDDQSWLVRGSLSLTDQPIEWVDRRIIDIARDRIATIAISHPDSEQFVVYRDNSDERTFKVADMPAERTLKYEGVADVVAEALSGLDLENVKHVSDMSFDASATTHIQHRTFDGLIISTDLVDEGSVTWARFAARTGQPLETPSSDAQEKPEADAKDAVDNGENDAAAAAATIQKEADDINARVDGWVYAINATRASNLRKRMADVLVEPKTESDADDDASTPGSAN